MTRREGCRHVVAMRTIARGRSHIVISTVLIVLLGTSTVFAQKKFGENRVLFGTASTSCGTWNQLRPAAGALKDRVPAEFGALLMWVLGFISGANADPSHPDVLLGSDLDGLIGWIDNYCRAHPLESIASAASGLIVELRSARRR
jgi:hypothetical protein